jgi:hypothetical protein
MMQASWRQGLAEAAVRWSAAAAAAGADRIKAVSGRIMAGRAALESLERAASPNAVYMKVAAGQPRELGRLIDTRCWGSPDEATRAVSIREGPAYSPPAEAAEHDIHCVLQEDISHILSPATACF